MTSSGNLTIGKAAVMSGVPAKTIRYYEEAGVIANANRNDNSYRTYTDADVQTLRFIAHARKLGFSLKKVRELLSLYQDQERASKDVRQLALEHLADLDRRIFDLMAIRSAIADLAGRCRNDERPECPIIDALEGLTDLQKRSKGRRQFVEETSWPQPPGSCVNPE
ncbi:Cu(I)-responsive transcriptional regulator [Burkholderia cepacia]|uniref:Cu(I)-responsive transcriptional regulator n=1 Tax=Burkholderia cepacia TaxID=292 RepID=UPI002AB7057E|nr:Cu(I)-responsive transcriptional regulator [Burkholderia cepacia]